MRRIEPCNIGDLPENLLDLYDQKVKISHWKLNHQFFSYCPTCLYLTQNSSTGVR
jgi:NADH pyrophosphatase NudC (nudix superfamily)